MNVPTKPDGKDCSKSGKKFFGSPASQGIAENFCQVLEKPTDNFVETRILVCEHTDPDWLPLMIQASAVVAAEGGVLSHTAITSRELGIPCVVGVGHDILKLEGFKLRVDGNTGCIIVLEAPASITSKT